MDSDGVADVTKPDVFLRNDMNTTNVLTSTLQPPITRHDRTSPQPKHEIPKKFIPSPELIIDSSQSSESNERFVINNHRYVIPPVSKNSRIAPKIMAGKKNYASFFLF